MAARAGERTREKFERRAPGWAVWCLKCGFTEPWGKYGLRLWGAGRPRTIGWCPRCPRIRCHVIGKRKTGQFRSEIDAPGRLKAPEEREP